MRQKNGKIRNIFEIPRFNLSRVIYCKKRRLYHELLIHHLFCRGGKMLQDSEGFKYYNKNGLYVSVDYIKSKSSCPKTLTYNEKTQVAQEIVLT